MALQNSSGGPLNTLLSWFGDLPHDAQWELVLHLLGFIPPSMLNIPDDEFDADGQVEQFQVQLRRLPNTAHREVGVVAMVSVLIDDFVQTFSDSRYWDVARSHFERDLVPHEEALHTPEHARVEIDAIPFQLRRWRQIADKWTELRASDLSLRTMVGWAQRQLNGE